MADTTDAGQHRQACAECQRRKQKCNREWPCNHCQKRKVADKCRFNAPLPDGKPKSPTDPERKHTYPRSLDGHEDDDEGIDDATERGVSVAADAAAGEHTLGLEAIGYMAAPLLARLGIEVKKTAQEQDLVEIDTCPQLERVLDMLPLRTQMDALVQSFFNVVNFHYYIIYPPTFLQEYQAWWDTRSRNKPLPLQWTCLLVMICACATQHLDVETKPTVELDLGGPADDISEEYHNAGRELASVIPVGHYHLLNVQRMLHSIYWFKAEARFLEAWHVINDAVREAQELGFHKEEAAEPLPEFEREMRRRAWCILDSWDWQFASGLYRPTIIDHTDADVKLPTLALEDFTPSPLLHMKLQSELIRQLAARFGAPKNVTTTGELTDYQIMIEDWIKTFPAVYDIDEPDKTADAAHTWITFHRYYIHTMAYLMILNPIRAYMAKTYDSLSPKAELRIREAGVYYSLRNLQCTTAWVHHVSHRDGRFHFIIFSLFDTAAVLSTAIIKDVEGTIPRRGEIVAAIDGALHMLKQLNSISKTAKTSHDILSKMARRVLRPKGARKKARMAVPSPPMERYVTPVREYNPPLDREYQEPQVLDIKPPVDGLSPHNVAVTTAPSTPPINNEHSTPANLINVGEQLPPAPTEHAPHGIDDATAAMNMSAAGGAMGIESMADPGLFTQLQSSGLENMHDAIINDETMGDFTVLWDWPSLGLDFITSDTPR